MKTMFKTAEEAKAAWINLSPKEKEKLESGVLGRVELGDKLEVIKIDRSVGMATVLNLQTKDISGVYLLSEKHSKLVNASVWAGLGVLLFMTVWGVVDFVKWLL